MKPLSTAQFYQDYFAATQTIRNNWLNRLMAEQQLEVLERLMQWQGTPEPAEDCELPTRV